MSLEQALVSHQQGDLAQAERLYREILQAEPRNAEALHCLGVLALQTGHAQAADELIGRSVQIDSQQPVAYLNLSNAQRELQRLEQALASVDRALFMAPDYADALNNRGDILIELHRPQEALASLERALHVRPQFAMALNNRGNALGMLGRTTEALESYERALELQPDFVRAHNNRGMALRDLRRLDEALTSFEHAMRLDPNYLPAVYNCGNALLELKRHAAALECYERLLQHQPDDAEALVNRGVALTHLKRYPDAFASFDHVLRLQPRLPVALNGRGNLLREMKQPGEALAHYELALAQAPDDVVTLRNCGNALADLHRFGEAILSYDRAAMVDPKNPDIHNDRANALQGLYRFDQAMIEYRHALDIDPNYPPALFNSALTLLRQRELGPALDHLRRLLTREPDYPYGVGFQLQTQLQCCDWVAAADTSRRVVDGVIAGRPAIYPFALLPASGSPVVQLRCARSFVADQCPPVPNAVRGGPFGHERIRVAYVSRDFRDHAVSFLMAGIFETHDRRHFENIAVSFAPALDTGYGRRVRAAFDRFLDVSTFSDAAVAELMRKLQIDIAVDLMGYTEGTRPVIFAHRAAPVQVNYLGFPATMGADYIDYIIADEFVIPPSQRPHYAEQVVYLPECFQANDAKREIGERPSRVAAGLPESGFVWCCFNANGKITAALFDVWMRLLRATPGSVLWLVADVELTERNLRQHAQARGVDPERLVFARTVPYAEHLARLQLADLFLDTLPFTAGTSASDALWAGVPVLTCTGEAFATRMAGSLSRAAGLPELVTDNFEAYEKLALLLAQEPQRLAGVRDRLAENRGTCPLFDTQRFCRHLEAAYKTMWERSERGELPASFAVPPLPR